jgi:hypothetical protein
MDFDAQTSVVTVTEFLAVLIAGFGNKSVDNIRFLHASQTDPV